jgi:hypothetical protein
LSPWLNCYSFTDFQFLIAGSKTSVQTNEQNLPFQSENKLLILCVAGSSSSSVDGDATGQTAKPHQSSGMEQDVKVWLVFHVIL